MRTTALIIGGGLGGLFAGAILAKEGVGVTILEKNHIIGGGLQSFRRMGLSFDTGMHVLAGMEEGQSIRRLCEWLGIYDKIRLHHIGPFLTVLVERHIAFHRFHFNSHNFFVN